MGVEELVLLPVMLIAGVVVGLVAHKAMVAAKQRGCILAVGIDTDLGTAIPKYIRPDNEGLLWWQRGKERGRIVVSAGSTFENDDGTGRIIFVNRQTLQTYGVHNDGLRIAPDDGWTMALHASGQHERNVARSGGEGDWLTQLVKYTPIMCLVLIVLVLGVVVMVAT